MGALDADRCLDSLATECSAAMGENQHMHSNAHGPQMRYLQNGADHIAAKVLSRPLVSMCDSPELRSCEDGEAPVLSDNYESCHAYIKHKHFPDRTAVFENGCCRGQESSASMGVVAFGGVVGLVEVQDLFDRHCP